MKTVCSRKYISAARKLGIANKKIALKKYEEQLNTTVSRSGFLINQKWSWFGCSPGENVLNSKALLNPLKDIGNLSCHIFDIQSYCNIFSFSG